MQLYLYEMSEFAGIELTEYGLYPYSYIDHYWTEKGRHPFFLRVDGKLAGLALVRTWFGDGTEARVYSMDEFFVKRQYQGKGVGKRAAHMLFDRFQGKWSISQLKANKPAQTFWQRTIAAYRDDCLEKKLVMEGGAEEARHLVQTFHTNGKTLIYLVRHAEAEHSDDEAGRPLTAQGLLDAEQVARDLAHESFDAIFSSPYRRAVQTVEPLAAQAAKTVQLLPAFRERGLGDGVADLEKALFKSWRDFDFAYPGGESNAVAKARGVAAVEQLAREQMGHRVAVGTHGTLLGLILHHYAPEKYDLVGCRQLGLPDIFLLVFSGTDFQWLGRL